MKKQKCLKKLLCCSYCHHKHKAHIGDRCTQPHPVTWIRSRCIGYMTEIPIYAF